MKAHRYIYETLIGPIAANVQQLDHLCRVRHCVNPAHLEPVAPIENVRRGLAAIATDIPHDLAVDLFKLVERVYRRGVYEGIRQASGRDHAA